MYANVRGPMGGPMHHPPMGMWHHPMGFFPMGGIFILPALLFGGWIAIAVVGGVLSLIGTIIGDIFLGLASISTGVFSGSGIVLGIVIGLVAFYYFHNRKTRSTAVADVEE